MSRREILADANRARDIRRLQEQAALQALHRQQRIAAEARQDLDRLVETHAANEDEWAAALNRQSVDIGVLGLWRATAAASRERVRTAKETAALEDDSVNAHRETWAGRSRQADAAGAVATQAARVVRRAADEHALQTADDVLRFRRLRP